MKFLLSIIMIWNIEASAADMQRSIMNALYKQTGTENYVNALVKDLDKEYLPQALKNKGFVVLMLLQSSITHQIGWKWSF